MVTVVCFYNKEFWSSREKAMDHYFHMATVTAGGRECDHYCRVYNQLSLGKDFATDGSDMIFFEDFMG